MVFKLKTNRKKLIIFFLISTVAVVILYLVGFIHFGKFKTVTYDNGEAKYSLKFYAKHSVTEESPPLFQEDKNYKEIQSRYSINGKDPISLVIRDYPLDYTNNSYLSETCESPMARLATVFNSSINKEINICAESNDPSNVTFYFATFNYEDKRHLVSISQNYDFSGLEMDDNVGQKIEDKIGLQTYIEDIKTIVSSIKPLR